MSLATYARNLARHIGRLHVLHEQRSGRIRRSGIGRIGRLWLRLAPSQRESIIDALHAGYLEADLYRFGGRQP